jgi:recombination protein RecA
MATLSGRERDLAIEKVLADINKKFGTGAIVVGADAVGLKVNRLKTGSLSLDVCTGGGWAMGRMNEIFGKYSSGKSYISMLTTAQTQKDYPNSNIGWVDFEGSFDKEWAKCIGVDTDKLLMASPETMEQGLQIAVDLIKSGEVILVVIDSLAAACPEAELEGDMTAFTIGLRARLGNQFARKSKTKTNLLSDDIDIGQTTLLIINQQYSGIGTYATDETPGGVQVKHASMVRVNIRKGEKELQTVSPDGTLVMQGSRFVVEKNRTFPPKKAGSFLFSTADNPRGKKGEIYRVGEILTYGIRCDIIERKGAWYYLPEMFGNDLKFQGEVKLAEWMQENPEGYAKLEETVMQEVLKLR